ncbi:MAG: thymidine phosphorylase, partial [Acetobacteraceae bacterium]|nr:thymidine phosphorylase [Acetobacteraceae bacterium]
MRALELIRKKRDGGRLSREEYDFLVRGLLSGEVPDYQVSAFLMAAFIRGMAASEAADLTLAMVTSGGSRPVPPAQPGRVDKHSTGGVGDKTTLVVAPLVAACGVPVAKMSGRGLGHTGGTLDKLESIPGFRTDLTGEELARAVERAGVAVAGQGSDLVPADKVIYAIRDVTATVECPALIASSVMSKKIAGGAEGIVLDVKAGSGAFCKTVGQALGLAALMVGIGRAAGRRVVALVTDMDQPLGRAVGNALEVEEAIMALRGQGPPDLERLSLVLAEEMLCLARPGLAREEARARLRRALDGGQALERLRSDQQDAAALAAAFRAIHTIKGMAGMMSYGTVAELAHEVEALLAAMRDGRSALEPSGVALLEEGCDWLEALCERAVAGGTSSVAAEAAPYPSALDALLRRLKDAQVGQGGVEKSEGGSSRPSVAPRARERADDLWSIESERVRAGGRYVRIELRRLDALMDLTGELVVARGRLAHHLSRLTDREVADAAATVDRIVSELQDAVMASRLVPAWELLDRFPRVVREAARSLGKEVEFEIEGRDIELDRSLLDQMVDPLVHLLRNAVDHGIEPPEQRLAHGKSAVGRIVLHAAREESSVVIRITDDGRGIDRRALRAKAEEAGLAVGELGDEEILRIIARPGFSTADRVTQLSGRGVGMDVVVARVRALGGSVELRTREGEGTTVTLRLPATLAIVS